MPRLEILEAGSEEDVVLLLGVVELVALGPVIAHGIGKDLAVLVEGALGDGRIALLRGLQLGPGVLVPEGVASVRAYRRQSSVDRVERDVIHRVDVLLGEREKNGTVSIGRKKYYPDLLR